ncbi:MAG: hypothetical protein Q8K59_10650 [Nitrosomonas sp.]|nr:hypothetical protein [Nitrosomonas sp.]MDP1951531.1 hypothetical protein [Nitrosomonas sp.]
MATIATPAFAQANYPVKLKFEEISRQQVNTLLSRQNVPKIIALSWNEANEKFLTSPPSGVIARYDLNDNGREEVFLYTSGNGMCGSGGCHLIIFQFNKENEALEYKTTRSSSADILILNSLTSGFHNIAIRLMEGTNKSKTDEYTVYQWKNGDLAQTGETIIFQPSKDPCD